MDAINLLCRGLVSVEQYEELLAEEHAARMERNERSRERRQRRVDAIRHAHMRNCEERAWTDSDEVIGGREGFAMVLDWAAAVGVEVR